MTSGDPVVSLMRNTKDTFLSLLKFDRHYLEELLHEAHVSENRMAKAFVPIKVLLKGSFCTKVSATHARIVLSCRNCDFFEGVRGKGLKSVKLTCSTSGLTHTFNVENEHFFPENFVVLMMLGHYTDLYVDVEVASGDIDDVELFLGIVRDRYDIIMWYTSQQNVYVDKFTYGDTTYLVSYYSGTCDIVDAKDVPEV